MPEWLQIVFRTLIAIVVMFFYTKALGKRQIAQLSLFEYITGITIGSLTAYISLDMEKNWHLGLVALTVWVIVTLAIEYLQIVSKKGRDFTDGNGTILIRGGKVLEKNLRKERLTADELLMQLRAKNAFKVADVEFAILEPGGMLNVLLKKEYQPVTAKILGIQVAPEPEPQTVVMDGNILDNGLSALGYNRAWLHGQLASQNVLLENVFLAQADPAGELYIDLYDDR